MKNKLVDLNNHLFAQLERLGDEDLKGDALKEEVLRSKSVQGIAGSVINNARLALDAEKYKTEWNKKELPGVLAEEKEVLPALKAVKNG